MRFALAALGALLLGAPVRAQSPAPVVRSVQIRLPPKTDPELLVVGPRLVDIVTGQRLSRRAVSRSIERLFATGRVADVVVRAAESDGGVDLVFELTPKRFIRDVEVDGADALDHDEVVAAARLEEGSEYYPERLERAVRAVSDAYRRLGYSDVTTAVTVEDQGTDVRVLLRVEEGQPTRVAERVFEGQLGVPLAEAQAAVGLEEGSALEQTALEDAVDSLRALYRQSGYYRARVSPPEVTQENGRARVVFQVEAGPRYTLRFDGNRSLPDSLLRAALGYQGNEPMDRALAERLAAKLERFYRFRGFPEAKARAREVLRPDGRRALLTFHVTEGRPLEVLQVTFDGNEVLSDEALLARLHEVVTALAPSAGAPLDPVDDPLDLDGRSPYQPPEAPSFDPARVWDEPSFRDAATALADEYRARGFLSARVHLESTRTQSSPYEVHVRFKVEEGPQARIHEVTQGGLPEGFTPPRSLLRFRAPLEEARVERERVALARALARAGYLFSQVDSEVRLSADGTLAYVRFKVVPGPRVRTGKVLVQGLQRTEPWVVRRSSKLREGDVLDPDALFETQRTLSLLGIFRSVSVRMIAPETVEPVKDVVIELRESPRLSGELGVGYFLAQGPRLVGDLSYPNIGGVALNASLRGRINYMGASSFALTGADGFRDLQGIELFGGRGIFTLQNRGLLPEDIALRFDFIAERVHRPSFRFTRFAGVPGLEWVGTAPFSPFDFAPLKFGLALQYELEHDRVSLVPGSASFSVASLPDARLRFPVGIFSLQSVRASASLDLRDDAVMPRRGAWASLAAERTWDIFTTLTDAGGASAPIQTLKVSGTLTAYFPVRKSWVLALSLRGGRIYRLSPRSVTIAPKRFFMGGASNLRGFREDAMIPADRRAALANEAAGCKALLQPGGCSAGARALLDGRELFSEGGELFTLQKVELRFPLSTALELGVFFESGNLWLDPTAYLPGALRYVAGAGVRLPTPIGPLALDFGVNLAPDQAVNEPAFNLHFNIGVF